MFISPDILKKLFVPFYKKMFDYVHNNSDCKVFFHSCGAIYDAIPLLIDAGIDILSPVQTSAFQMEADRLREIKKRVWKSTLFSGPEGVDTIKILPQGTELQVIEDVRRRVGSIWQKTEDLFLMQSIIYWQMFLQKYIIAMLLLYCQQVWRILNSCSRLY